MQGDWADLLILTHMIETMVTDLDSADRPYFSAADRKLLVLASVQLCKVFENCEKMHRSTNGLEGPKRIPVVRRLPSASKTKTLSLRRSASPSVCEAAALARSWSAPFSKRFGRHSPTYLSPQAEHQDPASYASFYAFVKPDASGGPSAVLDTPGTAPTPDNKNVPALERFWRLAGFTRVGPSPWVACYCSYYMLAPATIRRPSLPEILGQSAWPSPPWRYSRMSKTAQAASWCCQRVLPDSFDIIKKPMAFSTIRVGRVCAMCDRMGWADGLQQGKLDKKAYQGSGSLE